MDGKEHTGGASAPGPDAYSAALTRLLDGLGPDDDAGAADAAAYERASADVDALTRAMTLIGDTLAAPADATFPAEPAPEPAPDPEPAPAAVVPIARRRRRPAPRVLAAAAGLALVIGVGVPVSLSVSDGLSGIGGGSRVDSAADSAPAAPAPAEAPGVATGEIPALPGSAPEGLSARTDAATTEDREGAAEAQAGADPAAPLSPAAPADAASPTSAGGGGADAAAGSGAGGGGNATGGGAAAGNRAGQSASAKAPPTSFADDVACARAIAIGRVTAIEQTATPGRFRLTLAVSEWIAPASGPARVSYAIRGQAAISPGRDAPLQVGDRRLVIVPASPNSRIRAFTEPDWPAARERIARAQQARADQNCG